MPRCGRAAPHVLDFLHYVVHQGVARVCMVAFLKNNHGKFVCAMLFGKFQAKRRRTTSIGIDVMLAQFKEIRKSRANVKRF